MMDSPLLPSLDTTEAPLNDGQTPPNAVGGDQAPRLRRPDRSQVRLEPVCLEDRIPADHRVRMVWGVVQKLDLSRFLTPINARGSAPGRPSTDPHLLVALWLYAAIENVGSARRLGRLCEEHDAYRWLCGGVSINHHTLSDFRVQDTSALDDLLTQLVVALVDQDIVKMDRISQDSRRTRASAGRSSFRRRERLEQLREQARRRIRELKERALDEDDERSPRQRAAQDRAARERQERIDAALSVLPELEEAKTRPTGKPSRKREARVSTTDADARRMKTGSGAILPAYNLQFATDTASRVVVGVSVGHGGSDQSESAPLREQVQKRTGRKVKEHLMDGGYVKKELIDEAEGAGVAIYAPLPRGKDGEPCTACPGDKAGVKAWRERMQTAEGQAVYKERASTSETVNAELSCYRGLSSLNVRGLLKVTCAALWSVLAYNVVHYGSVLAGG